MARPVRSVLFASLLPACVLGSLISVAHAQNAPSPGTTRWSEPASWPNGKIPVAGDKVTFQVQQPDGPLRSFTLTHAKGRLTGPQMLEFNGQTAEVAVEAERAPAKK